MGQIACGENHSFALSSTPWRPPKREHVPLEDTGLITTAVSGPSSAFRNANLLQGPQDKRPEKEEIRDIDSLRENIRARLAEQERRGVWTGNVPHDKFAIMHELYENNLPKVDGLPGTTTGSTFAGPGTQSLVPVGATSSRPKTSPGFSGYAGTGLGDDGRRGGRAATQRGYGHGVSNGTLVEAGNGAVGSYETSGDEGHGNGAWERQQMYENPRDFVDLPDPSEAMRHRTEYLLSTANIVRQMKSLASVTMDAPADLERAYEWVGELRKRYDSLHGIVRERERQLDTLRQALQRDQMAEKAISAQEAEWRQAEEALEMKLSTVQIKIDETAQNRENYVQNISHLKEEENDHDMRQNELREQLARADHLLRVKDEVLTRSREAKARADRELIEFDNEIRQHNLFMEKQLRAFEEMHERAVQREAEREAARHKRESAQRVRREQERRKKADELASVLVQERAKAEALSTVNERLQYYRLRFQQITSATGLDNAQDIINKYKLKEVMRKALEDEEAAKHRRIEELRAEEAECLRELNLRRAHHEECRWKDVDSKEEVVRNRQAQQEKYKQGLERMMEKMALAQEGLIALLAMLPEDFSPAVDRDRDTAVIGSGGTMGSSVDDEDGVVLSLHADREVSEEEHVQQRTLKILGTLDKKLTELRERLRQQDLDRMSHEAAERERRSLNDDADAVNRYHAANNTSSSSDQGISQTAIR